MQFIIGTYSYFNYTDCLKTIKIPFNNSRYAYKL